MPNITKTRPKTSLIPKSLSGLTPKPPLTFTMTTKARHDDKLRADDAYSFLKYDRFFMVDTIQAHY